MDDVPVEHYAPPISEVGGGTRKGPRSAGALLAVGRRGPRRSARMPSYGGTVPDSSRDIVGLYGGRGIIAGNLGTASLLPFGMAEATGDRSAAGRSPRSSPRAGKPLTWRRGTVDRADMQEKDRGLPR